MPDPISFASTSSSSAIGSPIVLRETTTTRLVFVPSLIDNPNEASAALKGEFKYQRKTASQAWEEFETIPLSGIKSGEGFKLALDSSETLKLFEKFSELYAFVASQGVPMGVNRLVSVTEDEVLHRVQEMLDGNQVEKLFELFLTWTEDKNSESISELFDSENGPLVINFDSVIGAARLQHFLNKAKNSLQMDNEEFWQNLLKENSWAISQIYSRPIVILQGKAYLGGKNIGNANGTIVDFLFQNSLTKNALIVEIKKPTSSLMNSSAYRNSVHAPSFDLSGAILQTLTSRNILITESRNLIRNSGDSFEVFNPSALLITGRLPTSSDELRSFEIYRSSLIGLEIITYDELLFKVQQILNLLNGEQDAG